MKVKFYNIKYQSNNHTNINSEVVIEYEDDAFDATDLGFIYDDLILDLQNETGEYILDFECDILAN